MLRSTAQSQLRLGAVNLMQPDSFHQPGGSKPFKVAWGAPENRLIRLKFFNTVCKCKCGVIGTCHFGVHMDPAKVQLLGPGVFPHGAQN